MAVALSSRPYRTADDLALMQRLVQESWRQRKPRVAPHVGDLDWWMWQFDDPDPTNEIRLWFDGDELVGWAWLTPPASLDYHLHPDRPEGLLEEMLDWLTECATDGRETSERSVWALEHDIADVEVLTHHEFQRTEQHFAHTLCPLDEEPPTPVLPDGFAVRPVRGEEELAARVAVHPAAFAPSLVTEPSFLNVLRSTPYRPALAIAVAAPAGTPPPPAAKGPQPVGGSTGTSGLASGGAVAGVKFSCAYPMRPSTGVLHWFAKYARELDIMVRQVEDEICVANMTIGAAHMGLPG